MAYHFNNPGEPNGISFNVGAELLWHMKELLKVAGWTVTQSGDGTTYNAAGDELDTIAKFRDNTRAWFAIQDPGGGRAFTFQRVSNSANCRAKYAATGGFTGGTPSANTTPAATTPAEEQIIMGSGTDASPTGSGFGFNSPGILYAAADDAAPYGFALFGRSSSTGNDTCSFFMDPLAPNSYSGTDGDPVVIGWGDGAADQAYKTSAPSSGTSEGARAWLRKNSAGSFVGVGSPLIYGMGASQNLIPKQLGSDPESGDDITIPLMWGRSSNLSAPNGWKGISTLFRQITSGRANGDTLETMTRILVQSAEWTMPWNGTVPLV